MNNLPITLPDGSTGWRLPTSDPRQVIRNWRITHRIEANGPFGRKEAANALTQKPRTHM